MALAEITRIPWFQHLWEFSCEGLRMLYRLITPFLGRTLNTQLCRVGLSGICWSISQRAIKMPQCPRPGSHCLFRHQFFCKLTSASLWKQDVGSELSSRRMTSAGLAPVTLFSTLSACCFTYDGRPACRDCYEIERVCLSQEVCVRLRPKASVLNQAWRFKKRIDTIKTIISLNI